MKITNIKVYQIDMPFSSGPYHLSGGRIFEALDSTIISIETDEGITGWGETCPFGNSYLPGFSTGARAGIELIAPQLIGEDPRQLTNINKKMDKLLCGQGYLKSALDMACWDILGKYTKLPLYDLFGGLQTEKMPIVASVSDTATPQEMVDDINRFREAGYFHFSAKASGNPDKDIQQFKIVADQIKPEETLLIDANTGWTHTAALRVVRALKGFDLYIESPCKTYEETLAVRHQTDLPMMLDEIFQDINVLLRAYKDNAADVINLKISKVGGLTKAKLIKELCVEMGMTLTIQDTGGGEFVQAAIAHLAHSTPNNLLMSVWDCAEMTDVSVGLNTFVEHGYMQASAKPGLGIEPNMEVLGEPVASYS